jgi:hypothetical protein
MLQLFVFIYIRSRLVELRANNVATFNGMIVNIEYVRTYSCVNDVLMYVRTCFVGGCGHIRHLV